MVYLNHYLVCQSSSKKILGTSAKELLGHFEVIRDSFIRHCIVAIGWKSDTLRN